MASPYGQGQGGGPAANFTENTSVALDKPYDVTGSKWSSAIGQRIDEMFDILFKMNRNFSNQFSKLDTTSGTPVTGNVTKWTSATTLGDAGIGASSVVTGPGSVTQDSNIAIYNGTTGKIIKDSGTLISSLTGSVSWIKITLNNSQILTLHSAPFTAVAQPGSGLTTVPLFWYIKSDASAGAYSANPTINVQYVGNNSALLSGITPSLNSGVKNFSTGGPSGWGPITFVPENIAVQIISTADVTGGNVANSMLIMLAYLTTK